MDAEMKTELKRIAIYTLVKVILLVLINRLVKHAAEKAHLEAQEKSFIEETGMTYAQSAAARQYTIVPGLHNVGDDYKESDK